MVSQVRYTVSERLTPEGDASVSTIHYSHTYQLIIKLAFKTRVLRTAVYKLRVNRQNLAVHSLNKDDIIFEKARHSNQNTPTFLSLHFSHPHIHANRLPG